MAQIVKLRRSSVSGQKPTNSNLQLGELALNTTDGKVFMAVSGSGGPSVQELISTNTVNTGSINLIGAISASQVSSSFIGDGSGLYNMPLTGVTNLSTISGSLDSRLDVLEAYSGSQLVPSSSMSFRTLQTDVYCKNVTGVQINKGTVVRIVGSTGDNPLIGPADLLTEGQSANTLGIATENIPNDGWGLVITEGVLTGVNTNGMTAGALLFLGTNGTFTTTPPVAPNHGVRLGEVLRVQQNNGSIYVRIDNGSELNEAHDVIYTGITTGDLLIRSGSVWKNGKSLEGTYNVTGSLVISQNLTVLGSSSFVYVTSSQLAVSASFISVNVFEPAERFGGLKVYDSGSSSATASLIWDSLNNHWVYQNASGSNYSGAMLLSGPRNTGSLGNELGLNNGYLPKSVGEDHLDNSIIRESGSTIIVEGGFTATSITGSIDFTNLINRPTLVSGSLQIELTGTTGYSGFSSSIATTNLNQENRLNSLETESGSIRNDLNSFTSSINTTIKNKLNSENVISGSIQVELTGTTGYSGFSSSISTSINDLSSSLAITDLNQSNRLDSIEGVSGSYATTGSNTFNGNQIISGSINVENFVSASSLYITSGSRPTIILNDASTNSEYHITNGQTGYLNIHHSNGSTTPIARFGTSSIDFESPVNVLHSITSSYFTGSFIGDGQGLYNIPASGVTGLELFKIATGSISASLEDGSLRVNTDVYVDGTLTAKELHIDYVTSSVLYQSGSTKFGDTNDDTHQFTGSVLISGSIVSTDTTLVSGSSQIDITGTTGYSTFSSSVATITNNVETRVGSLETESGSIRGTFNTFTSSYTTGSFTGSFIGNASGLIGVPFHITGSDVDGNTYDKTFTKLQFDDETGLNVSESNPGTAFISIGSHFRDIFVSGSGMLRATGSDAFEVIGYGGVEISVNNVDSNYDGYSKELIFSTNNLSSSFNTRINQITGSISGLTTSYNSFTSSVNSYINDLNNFTSSVVLTSETSSMSVLSASYALTAAFALNALGTGTSEGRTARLDQTSASTTWSFNHNLGEQYPSITVFDSNDNVIIPATITAVDSNNITITFPSAQSGHAVATVGGGLPYVSGSYDGYVLAVASNAPTWKGGMISGSLQITNFGYSTTGSNTFVGDQTVEGTITIRDAQFKQFTYSGLTVGNYSITTVPNALYDGAFFDYVAKSGANRRIGTVMATWDGSNVVYNEVTTTDIGNTSAITMSVTMGSGVAELRATISSGTWNFKTLVRAI